MALLAPAPGNGGGGSGGAATTGAQYLFESIVSPDAYIVPGGSHVGPDGKSIMPHNYGTVLDAQKLADIIAYLETLQ